MGIADKTYYLDENRELTDKPEDAAFVLINEGQEIPAEMADRYGIGKVVPEGARETAAVDETVTEKAAAQPKNKAKTPAKNK